MDELLLDRNLVESRSQARALILGARVFVGGTKRDKAGVLVDPNDLIEIRPLPRFVSRGGEKLDAALRDFGISVEWKVCLDVGSSTGGFTDCLLQHGAAKVYAVDVGWGQLHPKLRSHPRVTVMEKTHILRLSLASLETPPSVAVVDVSFISLKKVLPKITELLTNPMQILALFKPQFEVGPKNLKKGIVREESASLEARKEFEEWVSKNSLQLMGWKPSVLKGAKGNQEYFALLLTKPSLRGAIATKQSDDEIASLRSQ